MKYCPQCRSEYVDTVTRCADCGADLVEAEVLPVQGPEPLHDLDTRRFAKAGTVDDPLTCEQLVAVLREAKLPVIAREIRGGSVDLLTSGTLTPWWELLVPEEHLAKAAALMEEAKQRLEAESEKNAQAAEEEATAGPGEPD